MISPAGGLKPVGKTLFVPKPMQTHRSELKGFRAVRLCSLDGRGEAVLGFLKIGTALRSPRLGPIYRLTHETPDACETEYGPKSLDLSVVLHHLGVSRAC